MSESCVSHAFVPSAAGPRFAGEFLLEIVSRSLCLSQTGLHQLEALRDQVFGIDHWIGIGVRLHGVVAAISARLRDSQIGLATTLSRVCPRIISASFTWAIFHA